MATEKQNPIHAATLKPLITSNPNNGISSSIHFASSSPFPLSLKDTSTASTAEGGSSVSHILRKINRAERFGISVHLSEAEKRYSRAERFGIDFSDALEKSEELKRKARAERFGFSNSSLPTDEEAKKKARIARFAPVSESNLLVEGKRKARTIRIHLKGRAKEEPRRNDGQRANSYYSYVLKWFLSAMLYEHIAGTKAAILSEICSFSVDERQTKYGSY